MCTNNSDGCLSKHYESSVLFGGLTYNQVPHCTMVSEIQLSPRSHLSDLADALQVKMIKGNPSEILACSVYRSQRNNAVTEGSLGFNMLLTQIKDPACGCTGLFTIFGSLQQEWVKEEVSRGVNTLADTKMHLFNNDQTLAAALCTSQNPPGSTACPVKQQALISLRQACKCIK